MSFLRQFVVLLNSVPPEQSRRDALATLICRFRPCICPIDPFSSGFFRLEWKYRHQPREGLAQNVIGINQIRKLATNEHYGRNR